MYQHLMSLFQRGSEAHQRISERGSFDINDYLCLNAYYDDRTAIYNAQLEQVFIFHRYAPAYLNDLRLLNGISEFAIWHRNGHDR